jgi:hypothetical protein
MQRRPISAIIFGILNIGFAAFSWIELLLFKPMASIMAKSAAASDPAQMHWQWIASVVDAAAALAQLAGGAGLLAGQRWGRILSLAWAWFDIVFCLTRCPLTWDASRDALAAAHVGPGAAPVLTWIAAIIATIASMIYPGLLIYFMTRPKLKTAYSPAPSA